MADTADVAIRKLDQEFMDAAGKKDAARLVRSFYAPDAVLMAPNQPLMSGHRDIQAFFHGLLEAGAADVKLQTEKIESAGDLAYGRGTYSFRLPTGGDRGKYVVVYRRQPNGAWLAIVDSFNSDQPTTG